MTYMTMLYAFLALWGASFLFYTSLTGVSWKDVLAVVKAGVAGLVMGLVGLVLLAAIVSPKH